ncbi:histidine kinase [Devosia rhodophyticola]|uniref:Histidine kinase n=1 Tax=Devosia rhodophyticola TaxID=3026423 RepID=A0ABY7YV07_9HYPH|nr:histidine kinase [Devosia rhodophyticola]WDR04695.1 histidine kinase [Devosia rhodophyticola]
MPTLIRLLVALLFLAGLAYGGMIALIAYVQPTPKEVTVRISTTDLLRASAPDNGPLSPLPSP